MKSDPSLRLKVKLYGTLSRSFDQYDHMSGLDIDLPKGASIEDLLIHLDILPKRVGMVLMDEKPVQKKARLNDGVLIKILQPIAGG